MHKCGCQTADNFQSLKIGRARNAETERANENVLR